MVCLIVFCSLLCPLSAEVPPNLQQFSASSNPPFPPILAIGGLSDPRVTYWEPAKWVAKLRATKTDTNMLLLKTEMTAGHGGASGRFDSLKENAFEYAFVLKALT